MMKKSYITLVCLGLIGIAIVIKLALSNSVDSNTLPSNPALKINGETISIEIADTSDKRERGLSGHESLTLNQAMLFVFPYPGNWAFWMKDMKFPIDIIWLDENFRIVYIVPNATPESYPETFVSPRLAQFVLEAKAGFASRYNLTTSSQLDMIGQF